MIKVKDLFTNKITMVIVACGCLETLGVIWSFALWGNRKEKVK